MAQTNPGGMSVDPNDVQLLNESLKARVEATASGVRRLIGG